MIVHTPLTHDVDVLVLGATTGAVEAAVGAAHAGCRVLCVTHHTYPGEDICAPMAYWPRQPQQPRTELAGGVLSWMETDGLPRPMQIKYTLEQALIQAGVDCLYMTHPVRLLIDADGRLGGAIVANRSGFQAVAARVIVDATARARLARETPDATFRAFQPGRYAMTHIVAGDPAEADAADRLESLPGRFDGGERQLVPYRYSTQFTLGAAALPDMARAEAQARREAWYAGQLLSADVPQLALNDGLVRDGSTLDAWSQAERFDLEVLRAATQPLFVLGPLAAVSGTAHEMLSQPAPLMTVGRRLGELAAAEARGRNQAGRLSPESRAAALQVLYPGIPAQRDVEVVRHDRYFRAQNAPTVALDLNRLPTLGTFDVVIAGGGTAGAPAAVAAGRAGGSCVVLEYLPGLGGMTTRGRIASYYHGNRCGFTSEVDAGVHAMGHSDQFDPSGPRWNTEWKEQWFLQTVDAAGADVWFHTLCIAAARDRDRVCGVVAVTPYGWGLVRAGAVVDASGNADVAAAAGAATVSTGAQHVAVQGTGLAPLIPGAHYTNTDHTFIDDSDAVDVTRAFAVARSKFRDEFDLTLVVDSRQRRQISGDLTLQPLDFLAGRTFPDTITTARSNFDTHGFTIHPVFMAKPPDKQSHFAHVPLRCLLPDGLERILVTGLGVSCHRDALPVIRMQPDVQNQGYAAGRAAAMAVRSGLALRQLDVRALQAHLVEVGILQPEVATHQDSFPLSDQDLRRAVEYGMDAHLGLAVIFSDPERSLPLLRRAHAAVSDPDMRLRYAQVLALMGDAAGVPALAAALDRTDWDEGWHYTGMGQFGFSLSPVDSLLAALGYAGDRGALAAVLRKLEALRPDHAFSHFRALTLALERLPAPEAAPHMTALLEQVGGHAVSDLATAVAAPALDRCDTSERNRELKELLLARGLLACGDPQGRAHQVLAAYSEDLHGHYARHARALLAAE